MGPRGSGKTTWLRATFPDAYVFDLLSEETYQRLLARPGFFADELRAVSTDKWVIVDEVPEAARTVERRTSVLRRKATEVRPLRIERSQAEASRRQPTCRASTAPFHASLCS